jgi:hypothetical protein
MPPLARHKINRIGANAPSKRVEATHCDIPPNPQESSHFENLLELGQVSRRLRGDERDILESDAAKIRIV